MNRYKSEEQLQLLAEGLLSLRTEEECRMFLEDLCTAPELEEMSRRLYAAKLLSDNRIYTEIAETTGLSTATISRVSRCLKYGPGGYRTVLERLSDREKEKDDVSGK